MPNNFSKLGNWLLRALRDLFAELPNLGNGLLAVPALDALFDMIFTAHHLEKL